MIGEETVIKKHGITLSDLDGSNPEALKTLTISVRLSEKDDAVLGEVRRTLSERTLAMGMRPLSKGEAVRHALHYLATDLREQEK